MNEAKGLGTTVQTVQTAHDAEIARRYASGQSTGDIAQELGLRLIDVIGRVRQLGVQPPAMGMRRAAAQTPEDTAPASEPSGPRIIRPRALAAAPAATPEPGTVIEMPATPNARRAPRPLAADRPAVAKPATDKPAVAQQSLPAVAVPKPPMPTVPASYVDEDLDDDEPVRRAGCPRGWLVSEARLEALFAPSLGRFEDVVFKQKVRPVGSLTGQSGQKAQGSNAKPQEQARRVPLIAAE
jgi:hypothetical protein